MIVFVTGGSGFIGSRVVRELIEGGHSVKCLLRPTSDVTRLAGLDYTRVDGDIRDARAVRAGAEGCGAIIHLAGIVAWGDIDSPLMEAVVVEGTRHVLDAARAMPGTRVVYVSSIVTINGSDRPQIFDESAAYTVRDDDMRYSRAKRRAEACCREANAAGVPVVVVNPGEVFGPNDTGLITAGSLVDFATKTPVMVCDGGTSVAFLDDVALAIVRALERGKPGERYILSGQNLTVLELATLCLDLLGLRTRIVRVPNAVFKSATKVATLLHLPLPYNPKVVPYATKFWFTDASKAERELGVSFRPAREALVPTLAWLSESGRLAQRAPA